MHHRLAISRWVTLLCLCAAAWWILTEGTAHSWGVGIPTILVVTYVAARLQNPAVPQIRLHRLPGFAFFFLTRSVVAGVNVSRRTFSPRLDLNPGYLRYRSQLPQGTPRLLFVVVNSLLPGSLCAEFDGDDIIIHVLDVNEDNARASRELDQRIALLFGLENINA